MDLHPGQIYPPVSGHPLDALAHDRQCILGEVNQRRSRVRHGVPAQARRTSGHGEGQVQPEPGLGALGGAADHADRVGAPELFHEPARAARFAFDLPHAHHRKHLIHIHRHHHNFTFFLSAGRAFRG